LLAWCLSRAWVIGVAIAGSLWYRPSHDSAGIGVPRPLALLGSWDYAWYLGIARSGYAVHPVDVTVRQSNIAFSPLLPWIMRVGIATSTNPFLWAFIASNLAFLGALTAFHQLSADRAGQAFATRSTWILALAPAAVYASLAYTDGITLALAAGAALAATRGRWCLAGLAAAIATLARPQGVFIGVLIVLIAVSATDVAPRLRVRNALIGGVPPVATYIGFLAWLQVTRGSWNLQTKAEQAWGRRSPGWASLEQLARQVRGVVTYPSAHRLGQLVDASQSAGWLDHALDLTSAIVMFALIIALWRLEGTWRSPWVIFSALVAMTSLTTGILDSEMRYGLLAFPLIWPVARWLGRASRPQLGVLMVLAFALLVPFVLLMRFGAP
jgi:hypothetical protein